MNCNMCNDSMMRHFDRALNDIETAQMKQHLKVCKTCSDEFEAYNQVINFLEEDQGIEPPWDFEAGVMEKIHSLEIATKKRTDRLLVLIYSVFTVLLVSVSMLFLAGMKDISLVELARNVGESFSSFSATMATLHSIMKIISRLTAELMGTFFQTALLIFRNYYYVFIVLLAIFLFIQRMLIGIVRQDGGKSR